MSHIQGTPRDQYRMVCLEDMVQGQSIARVVDRFVELADLASLGFDTQWKEGPGRPSYAPAHMVKLYLFGYMSDVRSSRRLEKACSTDVEVMWLMEGLAPDFKTIADFRKDNLDALTGLFSLFGGFLRDAGLYGGRLCAIDGTKVRASSPKKARYSKRKLERLLGHHRQKAAEYLGVLADTDGAGAALDRENAWIDRLSGYLEELEASGLGEMSTTDPDARPMGNKGSGFGMGYNVQAAVDGAHNLATALDVVQTPDDHGHLSSMASKADAAYGKDAGTPDGDKAVYLADKGYFGGRDLAECERLGHKAIVARQDKPGEGDPVRKAFSLDKFAYDADADEYACPMGHRLTRHGKDGGRVQTYYDRHACAGCPARAPCLPKKSAFRKVMRNEYTGACERAAKVYEENRETYRKRQQTVEPVFGALKWAMGFDHFLLRGIKKVACEASLAMLGYNVKRACAVLGFDGMMAALDGWAGTPSPQPFSPPPRPSRAHRAKRVPGRVPGDKCRHTAILAA